MEFVLIAIGLLVFTAFVGVIIETFLQRRDRAARQGGHYVYPECGNCGYNVRGLPGRRCPECGAQLRAVGLVWKRD